MKLTISARGFNLGVAKFKNKALASIADIDRIIEKNVQEATENARTILPAQYGDLAASISYRKIDVNLYEMIADKDYAAYVEFGTGDFAASYVPSLEPEWQKLAESYIVTGDGTTPEEPYFYKAVSNMWPKMIEELQKATNARYK
jgi:hypothetical protein